jgi:ribonuclease J
MTRDFVNRANEVKPVAMITEGTRIDTGRTDESEAKVYKDSKEDILKAGNLVFVDFNFKDVDRFKTFYRVSVEAGRKMVISFKHACFLERYHQDRKLDVPDSKDENILILKPKRLTGTYDDSDYTERFIKSRLGYPNLITAEDAVKNPSRYMIVLNFWYFNSLVDLRPKGSLYIHSLSEPFNEEMELSFERMMNWLGHFKMNFKQTHCSGHCCGADIKGMIKTIRPKTLFPIHTERPEMFKGLAKKVMMVKEGKQYVL